MTSPAVQQALKEMGFRSVNDAASPEQSFAFWDRVAEIQRNTDRRYTKSVIRYAFFVIGIPLVAIYFVAISGTYPEYIRGWALEHFELYKTLILSSIKLGVLFCWVIAPAFLWFMGSIENDLQNGRL